MPKTQEAQVLQYIQRHGLIRPQDLQVRGWARTYLQRLEKKGQINRVSRGLYTAVQTDFTENHSTAEVCKRVPHAVVALLSALKFHNLTTQMPFEIWIAIDVKARKPAIEYPPIRVVRFSGKALSEGIASHKVEGVMVRVYNIPKTIADCFKYRHKIGLDVAIEALKQCREQRLASNDELWQYARICRVANVMQPYLQAIT